MGASTERASFLGKAGPLVLARFATALLTIAIPLVLARRLSLEDYGTYKQLILIFNTLYFVLPFGMAQGLYFFLPRADTRRPYLVHTLVFLLLAGSLAAILLLSLGGLVGHLFSNPGIAGFRQTLAVYTACMMGAYPLEISLTAQGKTKVSAVLYLVSDSSRALAMTLPVLLGFGLHGTMIAIAIYAVARLIACWTILIPKSHGPFFSWPLLKAQIAYAVPFGAAMALAMPQQSLHQYVVSSLVSPAMFALYAVGCFQLPIVDLLYTPTSEVLMVRLGELEKSGNVEEGLHAFREACAKLALVFLPSSAFLFAVAPEFIGGLFGARYLAAVPIFRICVLGIALAIFPVDGVLRARNHTRHIFLSYLVKALVTVPLVFFLVHRLGMIGGVLSWGAAELVGKAMLLWKVPQALSTERVKVTLWSLLPKRDLARAAAAALMAGVGVALARRMTEPLFAGLTGGAWLRVMPLAVAGVLFALGYLGALIAVGVRPSAVLASLRGRG